MKNLLLYLVIGAALVGAYVFRDKIKQMLGKGTNQINVPGIPNTPPSSEDLQMASVDFNECVDQKCNGPCYENYDAKNCMACQAKNCKSVAKGVSREMEAKFTGLVRYRGRPRANFVRRYYHV